MKNILFFLVLFSFSAYADEPLSYRTNSVKEDNSLNGKCKIKGSVGYTKKDIRIPEGTIYARGNQGTKQYNYKNGKFSAVLAPGIYSFYFQCTSAETFKIHQLRIDSNQVFDISVYLKPMPIELEPLDEPDYDLHHHGRGYEPGEARPEKPVIYLYPEKEIDVEVMVEPKGEFTFTYPKYNNGWNVTASPDGTLKDSINSYDYLFWESVCKWKPEPKFYTHGSYVEKENTIAFLESKLTKMGLNDSEKNDFITYWGPKLTQNTMNYIHFMIDEECNEIATMNIAPKPNSVFRVYMVYRSLSEVEAQGSWIISAEQEFKPINREGFTVIEWGGMKINNSLISD